MFSKIQLVDLTKSILANTESKVLCRACHAGPADEMTCSICGETKAVDGFAKAQRHDPERAVSLFKFRLVCEVILILLVSAAENVSTSI